MAKFATKIEGHHEYIWRCDCADWHYLQIEWDDNDPGWRILEIVDVHHPRVWRDRVAAAIRMLRGKPHNPVTIILHEKDIADIIEVLSKHSKSEGENPCVPSMKNGTGQ